MVKIKKTKKAVGQRGNSTHGRGSRKKGKGKGHKGGRGMAGTGKRADHKKSLIIKKYGKKYFGKQGVTSRKTERNKANVINLRDIDRDFDSLMKKSKDGVLDFKGYKILGDGDFKRKITIKADNFTKSAKEKIEKAGGKAVAKEVKKISEGKNTDKEKPDSDVSIIDKFEKKNIKSKKSKEGKNLSDIKNKEKEVKEKRKKNG